MSRCAALRGIEGYLPLREAIVLVPEGEQPAEMDARNDTPEEEEGPPSCSPLAGSSARAVVVRCIASLQGALDTDASAAERSLRTGYSLCLIKRRLGFEKFKAMARPPFDAATVLQ